MKSKILSVEQGFQADIKELDRAARLKHSEEGADAAVALVSERCADMGDALVKSWTQFFGELFMKYRDGYVITKDESNKACGCAPGNAPYSLDWNNRIVKDTGDHYRVPSEEKLMRAGHKGPARDSAKLRLLARR